MEGAPGREQGRLTAVAGDARPRAGAPHDGGGGGLTAAAPGGCPTAPPPPHRDRAHPHGEGSRPPDDVNGDGCPGPRLPARPAEAVADNRP
ncbi:hypothetical protein GCM10010376_02270 [Streptomyces violaceusniger]